jgi:hypothetical protein
MGRGVGLKAPDISKLEPGAFLSLYKIAHSDPMVDKSDNFAFRLLRPRITTHCGRTAAIVRAVMTPGIAALSPEAVARS